MIVLPKVILFAVTQFFRNFCMLLLGPKRSLSLFSLLSLSTVAVLVLSGPAIVQAQTPPAETSDPAGSPDSNAELRPLVQDGNILSVSGGQRLMQEASAAVSAQNYPLAVQKLQAAREVFNQLSNFYQQLAASFSGIDVRIADGQRQQAIATAQMRDEATYQLALVHRAENKPELSVPLLIQIVRSQNPTRELGQKAYQQLYELGFVDSPYPRNQNSSAVPR